MTNVSFDVPAAARPFIESILNTAASIAAESGAPFDRLHHEMNLCACHANGNPLDFVRLSQADRFNIAHDVFGIDRHIDRDTGQLRDFFSPRFSKRGD